MAEEVAIPSVKDLASSDPKLRTAAFKAIQEDLKTRQSLTYLQALQLWKGLFALLYLTPSHPPLPHQRLIISVASLTSLTATPSSSTLVPLTTAFWETIVREWASIDSHRMDKYLLLTRFVIKNTFINIFTLHTQPSREPSEDDEKRRETRDQLIRVFSEWPLAIPEHGSESNFRKVPEGLRYHVLDCWVDEIEAVSNDAVKGRKEDEQTDDINELSQVTNTLRGPITEMSTGKGVSKGIRNRAKQTLEDERWSETTG